METKQTRIDYMYDIDVFHQLSNQGFDYTLSENVLSIIKRIATKVGAPNYVKTPIFQKKSKQTNKKKKQKTTSNELTDEEWEAFRSFEKTTYTKNTEGINKTIHTIYTLLNKLTNDNYDDILGEIIENMEEVIADISESDVKQVSSHVFDVASTNKFYSNVYAKLYRALVTKYPQMLETFNVVYQEITLILENFEVCSQDDYEELCRINKQNDKRKALVCFIVNSMNEDLIDISSVYKIMREFIVMFQTKMTEGGNRPICEEISEIVSIMIETGFDKFKDVADFSGMWDTITELSEMNAKEEPSLSNKSLFKLMDLVEEYEDEF